jgi:hypothetical protein
MKQKEAFGKVRKVFTKWLKIEDPDVLDAAVASVLANKLDGNPVWLMLVGPAASLKSEIIDSMRPQESMIYDISDMSEKALISGAFKEGGEDASKIHDISGKVITLKDFTTILSKRNEQTNVIFSQFREIYDGHISKIVGTSKKKVEWSGKVGMLGGCTNYLEEERHMNSMLGERFVLYRLPPEDPDEVAKQAQRNANQRRKMKDELASSMCTFLNTYNHDQILQPPKLPPTHARTIQHLAILTAKGRVAVSRDKYSGIVKHMPQDETPGRLVQVYTLLAQALALVNNRREIGPREIKIVKRVALDTMFDIRRILFTYFYGKKSPVETRQVSSDLQLPAKSVLRYLEDMHTVKCLIRHEDSGLEQMKVGEKVITFGSRRDIHYTWELTPKWRDRFKKAKVFE